MKGVENDDIDEPVAGEEPAAERVVVPLLEPAEGVPPVTDTPQALAARNTNR